MFKQEINNYNLDLYTQNLTSDLIGFASIAIVFLITFFIAIKFKSISIIIFVALIFRLFIMLIGHYFINLPDSTNDAQGFEWYAWEMSKGGFIHSIQSFPGFDSSFYIWFMSIPYSIFGRSILMIQSIGLCFGIGIVFFGWLIAKKIWNERIAIKVGWVLALFPSLALYSVLPLREVYNSFFLLVAVFGIISWTRTYSFKSIIVTVSGFIGAGLFHGALLIGGIVFFIILGLHGFKNFFRSFLNNKIKLSNLVIIVFSLSIIIAYFGSNLKIPYMGTFGSLSMAKLQNNINVRMKGEASYDEWAKINSPIEMIYKVPVRAVYFLFSPFSWQVKKTSHLFGVLDGFLYLILVYLIFLNRKAIWKDPALRIILIILTCYIIMFSIGVSNFGSAVRHRTKFVVELILLTAPLIPKLKFSLSKMKKFKKNN